jgi:hypothetical protein
VQSLRVEVGLGVLPAKVRVDMHLPTAASCIGEPAANEIPTLCRAVEDITQSGSPKSQELPGRARSNSRVARYNSVVAMIRQRFEFEGPLPSLARPRPMGRGRLRAAACPNHPAHARVGEGRKAKGVALARVAVKHCTSSKGKTQYSLPACATRQAHVPKTHLQLPA